MIQKALIIEKNDIILTITSSGCNVLNFLLFNPKKILSVDNNPSQNYLLELKIKAIQHLNYHEFIELIGIVPSTKREEYYQSLRKYLSAYTQLFWDSHMYILQSGLTYYNEQDLKILGHYLRFLKGRDIIEKFFNCQTLEEQAKYFYEHLNGIPFFLFHHIQFGRVSIILGFCVRTVLESIDKKQPIRKYLEYVPKVFYPSNHLKKIERIFTTIPIKSNYFVSLMLLNRYIDETCRPLYLQQQGYPVLQEGVHKVHLHTLHLKDLLAQIPPNSITKFHLSNVFDWMSDEEFYQHIIDIQRVSMNGARFCYFSARDDRAIPKDIEGVSADIELSHQLIDNDRTFLYRSFEIGKISK